MKETLYRFGPFEFNPAERVLRRSGVVVQVTPKAVATLHLLVVAGGRVLSKEDLLRELWPDSFVEDGNLTQHISTLRKVFAADFRESSPIETIARVGYRFAVPVEEIQTEGPALSGEETAALPAGGRWTRGVFAAAALAVGLAVLGLAFVFRHQLRATFQPHSETVALTRFTTKATEDRVTAAAISLDGKLMAYADADGVVVQAIGDPATHLLRAPAMTSMTHLAWFPNGLHLVLSGTVAANGQRQAWVLSVVGDPPALLRDDAALAVPSPDGSLVGFTSGSGSEVWVAEPGGENARRVFAGPPNDIFSSLLWTRNGKTLLLQEQTHVAQRSLFPPGSPEAVHGFTPTYLGLDVASGRKTTSLPGMRFEDACLLKEDRLFFSRTEPTSNFNGASTLWTVRIDPATGAFASQPEKVRDVAEYRVASLTIATNGEIAAILNQGWPQVYVGDLHGTPPRLDNVKRLSFDAGIAYPHSWTADSGSVLYESDHYGRYQIYRQPIDRHDPEAIATSTELQSRPRLSPDHRWVLFMSQPSYTDPPSLFRVSAEGGSPVRLAGSGAVSDFRCPQAGTTCVVLTMQADEQAAFTAFDPVKGMGPELFRAPAAWKEVTDWDVSPDGSTLAVLSAHAAQPRIHTVLLASRKVQDIPLDLGSPAAALNWAADGKGWFVATSATGGTALNYVDLRGKTTVLRHTIGGTWSVPSPDGTKLAFVDQTIDSNVWFLHMQD